MSARIRIPFALAAAGLATLGYASLVERNLFTLRRFDVPVLPPDAEPLRVLHLSDLHLTPGQRRKQAWVRRLDALDPDLVVDTGDNLAALDAIDPSLDALGPLLARPGAFVFGTNDYYAPRLEEPAQVLPDRAQAGLRRRRCPGRTCATACSPPAGSTSTTPAPPSRPAAGWSPSPASTTRTSSATATSASPAPPTRPPTSGSPSPTPPSPGSLDPFAADGYDLLLAGHTHGGQVRVPFFGALVTNCGLDRARGPGLHRWPDTATWLHVSAGLGTHPYRPGPLRLPPGGDPAHPDPPPPPANPAATTANRIR